MTPDELAAIVARDAAVKFVDVTPTRTRVDAAFDDDWLRAIQDRRALLALLRETREALAGVAEAELPFADKGFGPTVGAPSLGRYHKAMNRARRVLAALAEP